MEAKVTNTTEAADRSDVLSRWWTVAIVVQLITCVFGVVGSVLSIYCVRLSKKMHKGMALQFYLFFITFFIICMIILPTSVVDEYYTLIGWQDKQTAFNVALHTIFESFERNVIGLIVVYRLMAVCFPVPFKLLSRPVVVLTLELVLFLGVLALWIIVFLTENYDQGDVWNPIRSDKVFAMYCFTLFVPIAVTTSSYAIMLVVRTLKRRAASAGEGPASLDSVSFAVGITILFNIFLDVLYFVIHFCVTRTTDFSFVIIRMIYRLHFALDPLCFVVFNRHYRKEIKTRGLAWLQNQASRLPTFASNALPLLELGCGGPFRFAPPPPKKKKKKKKKHAYTQINMHTLTNAFGRRNEFIYIGFADLRLGLMFLCIYYYI
ncbi:uncharacterized protein LOC125025587 [Penaeus chinensis]|uniref:uncharacterized protein LOC125025587 n=1 Tax=Penaeus chinensis TaxID=139456 RepID=UPI001FB6A7FF|nr:uncharacterized protein LOC125025587 [Penaeus chinensis]